ncbi:flagellar hook-length control protein FliK [Thioclava sp.]|uniref:flagellar hook-length control protein FliK n=1 Tax=Thioclava sp. TaxID=1933450 RepID=UPI003AA85C3A
MIPLATRDMLTVKTAPSNRDVSAAWPQSASPDMHFSLEFGLRGPTSVGRQEQWKNAVQQDPAGRAEDVEIASNSTGQLIHTLAQAPNSTSKQASEGRGAFAGKPNFDDTSLLNLAVQMPLEHSFANLASNTGERNLAAAITDATQTNSLSQMSPYDPTQTAFQFINTELATTALPSSSAEALARTAAPLETAVTSLDGAHNAGRQSQQTPIGDLLDNEALVTKPASMTTDGEAVAQNPLKTIPNRSDISTPGKGFASGARLEQSISQNKALSDALKPAFQDLPDNSLGLTHDRMVAMPEQPPIANLTTLPNAAPSTQVPGAEQQAASLQYATRHVLAHAATIQSDSNGANINAPQARGAQLLAAQTEASTTTQPAPLQGATPQSGAEPELGMTSTPFQVSAIRKAQSGSINAAFLAPQSGPASDDTSLLEPALSRDFSAVGETRTDARLDRLATSPQASASHSQISAAAPQAASTMLSNNPQAAQNIATRLQDDETRFDPIDDVPSDTAVAAHATAAARGEAIGNISLTAPTMAQSVSRQIAATVVQMGDQPVEIALSPEELGKVRLVLHASEHGMVVTVQAERPETLDLMRRNIGMLAADMRDLGYSELSFNFGDHPQQHSGQAESEATAQGLNSGGNRNVETVAPIPHAPKTPHDANASGLDLRI